MIKKRLAGVITVKDGWAVQSFGYARYLPLGRPEILVENLDRWGADEILVQCIDRADRGPDLALLSRIGALGVATPLIYAGGIRNADDGRAVVAAGADRIVVDGLLHDDPGAVRPIAEHLGAQAVIASLPLSRSGDGEINWLDHRAPRERPLDPAVVKMLDDGLISEAIVIDWRHEGLPGAFDLTLLDGVLPGHVPLIAFGGLSDVPDLVAALARTNVVAAGIGNFLSYGELSIQRYREALAGMPLRPVAYRRSYPA